MNRVIKSFQQRMETYTGTRPKVFIVPTKLGFFYIGITFSTFMMGLIYTNNMTLLVAFLLFSFLVVSMVLTNNQLLHLDLEKNNIKDGYASKPLEGQLSYQSEATPQGLHLELKDIIAPMKQSFPTSSQFLLNNLPRGQYHFERTKLFSTAPAGLFYAWRYYQIPVKFYVYPYPQEVSQDTYFSKDVNGPLPIEQDFAYHIPYERGMSAKRIDWKIYARNDQLYWKKHEVLNNESYHFDLSVMQGDLESRLQQLSYLVSEAFKANALWSLALGREHFNISQGPEHFNLCMQALASYREDF
jgi:uncharacterized protein (DUF58 family)